MGRVDCFKKIINHDYNLHDPDDPENKQLATVSLDDQGEIKPKKGKFLNLKLAKKLPKILILK